MIKALLVGINDYAPCGTGGPDLPGCINSVNHMAAILTSVYSIPSSRMTKLFDCNATKANILAALNTMVNSAVSGDVLIFYFSGHGSRIADVNGDEDDGFDEVLCSHDFPTNYIKDDELWGHLLTNSRRGVT